ncbi:MAG: BREX protein BrxB domain-containing protein, partial [Chloroflexota bacterium]|nr:BREX protein BrxB domain-containing protein [Chloroflexota bacterium]
MSLLDKFNELETMLLEQRRLIGLHSGVPFLILVYDPHRERHCRARQIELREKLEFNGIHVIEHELSNFIFDHYASQGKLERIFDLDRDPARRDELRQMIAGVYEKKLVDQVWEGVKDADPDRNVVFLTGVASMWPFARVSNLLTALENKIKVPLVVFYPGSECDG